MTEVADGGACLAVRSTPGERGMPGSWRPGRVAGIPTLGYETSPVPILSIARGFELRCRAAVRPILPTNPGPAAT